MDIDKLTEELKRDEGLRLFPYKCTSGRLTIGIGRNIEDRGITEEEAEFMLENDINDFSDELFAELPWLQDETDARQRALVNMAFNMGVKGVLNFRNMLAAMQDGDYPKAAREALNSKWARQVGRRAQRIADMIEEG